MPAARERLIDIARLGLDREAERVYLRDLVDDVAVRLDAPYVVIDVLLDRAQVFLAGHGPVPDFIAEAGGTPIEWAFCLPLLGSRRRTAIPDLAAEGSGCRANPLVTVAGVRAYAGAPLISHRGFVLGGLCALDVRPREFTAAELDFLQQTADQAVERLEERAGPE